MSFAPPTAVLHTWEAAADVRAGVPSPCHAIHGVAVVNGAMSYQIWRRGRTALPPSHTHSSGYKLDRGGTAAPPPTGSHTQDPAPGADLVSSCGANRGMT